MKIAGAMLICLSGFLGSSILIRREMLRFERVSALVTFVEYVRSAVENYSMSASQILGTVSRDLVFACGYNSDELPKSFLEMGRGCKVGDEAAQRIFFEFAENFGKSYRERQSKSCEECAEALKKRQAQLFSELSTRKKIITVLCLCISLALVILLL